MTSKHDPPARDGEREIDCEPETYGEPEIDCEPEIYEEILEVRRYVKDDGRALILYADLHDDVTTLAADRPT